MEIKVTADLLDGLVLALLESQDYYGYALTQDMQQAISISESTMYPVLRRLQKADYVTTYDAPYQGRNRRYYKITEQGEKHLQRIKKMWNDYKESLDSVFAAAKRRKQNRQEEGQHG